MTEHGGEVSPGGWGEVAKMKQSGLRESYHEAAA